MKKKKKVLLICLIIAIPILLVGGCFAATFPDSVNLLFGTQFSHSLREEIKVVREAFDLAELPESATDIKGYDWNNFFSGDTYLRFTASEEDIATFIRNSPGLANAKPELFSDSDGYAIPENVEWFQPSFNDLDVYRLNGDDCFGFLFVDHENHAVYITLII